jgi:hypothetical protein
LTSVISAVTANNSMILINNIVCFQAVVGEVVGLSQGELAIWSQPLQNVHSKAKTIKLTHTKCSEVCHSRVKLLARWIYQKPCHRAFFISVEKLI